MSITKVMHRALQIMDVLQIIIDHLDSPDLVRLSRTCSLLNGAATARLWKHADARSFKALTSMWISDYDSADLPPRLQLGKTWKRFQVYANLIQTLDLPKLTEKREDPNKECETGDLLAALALFGRKAPLLPHLRRLNVYAHEPHDLAGILLFLGPELEQLKATAKSPDEENTEKDWAIPIGCLLELIPERSPRISELRLGMKMACRHLEALADFVDNTRLSVLEIESIALDTTVLPRLARAPALLELYVGAAGFEKLNSELIEDDPEIIVDFSCIRPNSFLALRTLHIHESFTVIQDFLNVLPCQLDDLCLRFYPVETFIRSELSSVAAIVRARHSRVRRLELCFRERGKSSTPVSWEIFTPLERCTDLTHFVFNYFSATAVELTDAHINSMALAWPSLEVLELDWLRKHGFDYGLANEGEFTLAALASLRQNCPKLRLLVIESFDCMSVPPPPRMKPRSHPFELRVGRTRNDRLETVATYLCVLWPDIQVVELDRWSPEQEHFWRGVSKMLDVVRCLRAYETGSATVEETSVDWFETLTRWQGKDMGLRW